jgi:AGCS family alanine or glycine:cation symporter
VTGAWESGKSGSELTTFAFNSEIPGLGKIAVTLSLIFFSFSSVISWSYYGDRCAGYLFGSRAIIWFRNIFCLVLPLGAAAQLEVIWGLADIANGLMAAPNLIALLLLSPVVIKATQDYFRRFDK